MTLLVVVGATCIALGIWQLNRATERRAIASSIQQGQVTTAVDLNTSVSDPTRFKNWTSATAQGHWRGDLSVLLDNRNLEGRPGLWLATPLVMVDGRAVLVLRGWFARP
jgi:cytochrome oxidase assembly protein ShyY1